MDSKSYTSASVFPIKLVTDEDIIRHVKDRHIEPTHVQFYPTNKCPYNCSFCSCKNRDKSLEWTLQQMYDITTTFSNLGMKACTISGGGDPLAFPYIESMLQHIWICGVAIGLVTNARLLSKIDKEMLSYLTWCRISLNSETQLDLDKLEENLVPGVDWAFSFVLTPDIDYKYFIECVALAERKKFTHIRVVDDIINNTDNMDELNNKISSPLIIWQGRKKVERGNKRCLLSLIKPVVAPDGNVYPCCGAQFRKNPPALDLCAEDSMGNNYWDIWDNQKYFDGSSCTNCYYTKYNESMAMIENSAKLEHKKFI